MAAKKLGTKNSPETRKKISQSNQNKRKFDFVVIDPFGNHHIVGNRKNFADEHGLCRRALSALVSSDVRYRSRSYKKWRLSHIIPNPDNS